MEKHLQKSHCAWKNVFEQHCCFKQPFSKFWHRLPQLSGAQAQFRVILVQTKHSENQWQQVFPQTIFCFASTTAPCNPYQVNGFRERSIVVLLLLHMCFQEVNELAAVLSLNLTGQEVEDKIKSKQHQLLCSQLCVNHKLKTLQTHRRWHSETCKSMLSPTAKSLLASP